MELEQLSQEVIDKLLFLQKDEITSHHTYQRLARNVQNEDNSKVLQRIADEELRHYNTWKHYTKQEVKPDKGKITFFFWVSHIFGLTFGIKLMEAGEAGASARPPPISSPGTPSTSRPPWRPRRAPGGSATRKPIPCTSRSTCWSAPTR